MPAEVKLAVAADDGGANAPVFAPGTSPAPGELKGIGDTGATYKMALSNFRYVLNPVF